MYLFQSYPIEPGVNEKNEIRELSSDFQYGHQNTRKGSLLQLCHTYRYCLVRTCALSSLLMIDIVASRPFHDIKRIRHRIRTHEVV